MSNGMRNNYQKEWQNKKNTEMGSRKKQGFRKVASKGVEILREKK